MRVTSLLSEMEVVEVVVDMLADYMTVVGGGGSD